MTLAACSSVEWQPRSTADAWRGASLWATQHAVIGARQESAAAEVHELYVELCDAFAAVGEVPPSPPLILVVDTGDAPMLGDATRTLEQLKSWHQDIAHPGTGVGGDSMTMGGPPGSMSDAPPELIAKVAAVYAAAVPIAAPELELPMTWRALAKWGVVVPTEAVCADAIDVMVDVMNDHPDMTFGKRILMVPLMPLIRSRIRSMFREALWRQVVDAACAPSVSGRVIEAETKARLLQRLGVQPLPWEQAEPPE